MDDITPQQLIARMDAYLAQQGAHLTQPEVSQQALIARVQESNAELARVTQMLRETSREMEARFQENRAAAAAELEAWAAEREAWAALLRELRRPEGGV